MKKTNDGRTNQKTLLANSDTFVTSLVSIYSHTMESTEISGNEANKAPINELRFDISEIATITKLVIMNLLRI